MKFMITGASFSNTGAQAMMFTTVSELKVRFNECEIIVANSAPLPKEYVGKLNFNYVQTGRGELYSIATITEKVKLIVKECIKNVIGKETISLNKFQNEVKTVDVIIDISGFALGDQWSDENCLSFLARIEIAKKYNIPIFIMPQSIGPFEFNGPKRDIILKKIKEDLIYPKCIFTREIQGFQLLKDNYKLNNVIMSNDIVLQSNADIKNSISQANSMNDQIPEIVNAIAIIPNIHCYAYNPKRTINIYEEIINYLLVQKEKVYLLRHSVPDAQVCFEIKKRFSENDSVVLLNESMDCFKFNEIISNFKFAIASRFHSIIHAYKNDIPCIAIGWAAKYFELLKLFEQEKYVNDIRTINNAGKIIEQIENLEENYVQEKNKIMNKINKLQKKNCFDIVEKEIKKN